MHRRDSPSGQTLISAHVISSAGQGRVSGVITQREGMGQSQHMPGPVAANTGDLVMPWVCRGHATVIWGHRHSE